MGTTYIKNKEHIYKWREHNMDKHREASKKHQCKYRIWKKIKQEFLNILLEN